MLGCIDCGTPLTHANWSASCERGHRYICRPCAVARTAAYEAAHPNRRKRYNTAYYHAHRDALVVKMRAYYQRRIGNVTPPAKKR